MALWLKYIGDHIFASLILKARSVKQARRMVESMGELDGAAITAISAIPPSLEIAAHERKVVVKFCYPPQEATIKVAKPCTIVPTDKGFLLLKGGGERELGKRFKGDCLEGAIPHEFKFKVTKSAWDDVRFWYVYAGRDSVRLCAEIRVDYLTSKDRKVYTIKVPTADASDFELMRIASLGL